MEIYTNAPMSDIEDINLQQPQKLTKSQIISASRRTDIPAFYMDAMVDAMRAGRIDVLTPFGKRICVSLAPADVACFVWWSKKLRGLACEI